MKKMGKNKIIGTVLLVLAFLIMTGSIIANPYLTFLITALAVMTAIVCGVLLMFGAEEQK